MGTGSPHEGLARDRVAWAGLFALCLCGAFLYVGFDALPFQDLPAHAGLFALRHRLPGSPFEQRFYVYAPHLGPYSLFRGMGELGDGILGPLGAVRAMAMLPGLALPAALAFARLRLQQDRSAAGATFGVALSFGLMTLFGFASYLLALSVLVVCVTLLLTQYAKADEGVKAAGAEVALAAWACVLFVAHGYAYVAFLFVAGVACLAAGRPIERAVRSRALAPSVALAAWAAWTETARTGSPTGALGTRPSMTLHFQGALDKLSLLATPTLMTRTGIDLVAGVALWAILVATAVATLAGRGADAARPTRDHARALYASALGLLVVFALLPHEIGWFGFVDARLLPIVMVLSVMAYRRDALPRALRGFVDAGIPLLAATLTALALWASARFQDEARGTREVLSAIPPDARLLNLPLDPDSRVFTAHPFVHYDKLVMAERPVVVSDLWLHQGSAIFPTDANPALRLPASYRESDLRAIDWPAYRLGDWDYVLVRTKPGAPSPAAPSSLSLIRHEGGWWLFKTPDAVR